MGISAALFGTAAMSATATTAAVAATTGFIGAGGAFTLAGAATMASLAGTAMSALGSYETGKSQKYAYQQQAAIQAQQAAQTKRVSEQKAITFKQEQSNRAARAMLSGRTDPSALLLSENLAGEIQLQSDYIRAGGLLVSTRQEQQAAILRQQGVSARRSGMVRAGATIATDAFGRFS